MNWFRRPTAEITRRNDIIALTVLLLTCVPAYAFAAPFALLTVLAALLAAPFAENATLAFAAMCMTSLFGLWSPPSEACACRGSAETCMEIDGSVPDCHTTVNFRIYLQITLALGVALWLVNSVAYVGRRRLHSAVVALSVALFAHTWLAYKRAHWLAGLYVVDEPFCRMPIQRCSVMVGGLLCIALTLVAALCSSIRSLVEIYQNSSSTKRKRK